MEGVYRAPFKTHWNPANYKCYSLERGNGRCLRDVIIVASLKPFYTYFYRYVFGIEGALYHIGVGSDVVCSTVRGNCRSLNAWNGQQTIPRFFVS